MALRTAAELNISARAYSIPVVLKAVFNAGITTKSKLSTVSQMKQLISIRNSVNEAQAGLSRPCSSVGTLPEVITLIIISRYVHGRQ